MHCKIGHMARFPAGNAPFLSIFHSPDTTYYQSSPNVKTLFINYISFKYHYIFNIWR